MEVVQDMLADKKLPTLAPALVVPMRHMFSSTMMRQEEPQEVKNTDDGDELVQQVRNENPPEDIGIRDEWNDRTGWHRKEDIRRTGRTTNTNKINVIPPPPPPHLHHQRKLRGVEASGSKWATFELANELGIEGALLGYLAMGLAGMSLVLLVFLLLDYIRTRMKIRTSVRKNR